MSRSESAYVPRLIRDRPYRRHPHRHRTRRVLLDTIHAAGILIDIILIASCLIRQTAFVSVPRKAMLSTIGTALQAMILAMDVMLGACTG